jgi:nucleoside-diphosphate-sugar epimerase
MRDKKILVISSIKTDEYQIDGVNRLSLENRTKFLERTVIPYCSDLIIASKSFLWSRPGEMGDLLSKFKTSVPENVYYISSGAVYGRTLHPARECDERAPLNLYGLHKSEEERSLENLFSHITNLKILRPSNIFGDSNYLDVVNAILNSIKRREVLPLYEKGLLERDLLHIDDLTAAILEIVGNKTLEARIINISRGLPVSTNQIIDLVEDSIGSRPRIIHMERPDQIPLSSVLSNDLVKRLTNWTPSDLETSITAYSIRILKG